MENRGGSMATEGLLGREMPGCDFTTGRVRRADDCSHVLDRGSRQVHSFPHPEITKTTARALGCPPLVKDRRAMTTSSEPSVTSSLKQENIWHQGPCPPGDPGV